MRSGAQAGLSLLQACKRSFKPGTCHELADACSSSAPAIFSSAHCSLGSTITSYGTLLPQILKGASRVYGTAAEAAQQRVSSRVSLLGNLKQLSKFKLSSLVVLTASAGFVAGSGDHIDWAKLAWTSVGTLGAAACANTLNQIYEVANDRCMSRTCNRPLPAGRMSRGQALTFAVAAGLAGLGILYEKTNPLTTALGASNILLYAGIYTPLKQLSIANTWIGAVVGAIPPLMGWASAAGQLEVGSTVLAAALFFWQMPHFLALAWLCKDDYIRGGFKMLSGVDATGQRTAFAAMRHCIYLAPLGLLAYLAEVTTEPFAWEAAALTGVMGVGAVKFMASPSQATARKLFKGSLLYLPLLLAGLVVHRLPNQHTVDMAVLHRKVENLLGSSLDVPHLAWNRAHGAVSAMWGVSSTLADGLVGTSMKCPSKVNCDSASPDELAQEGDEEADELGQQQQEQS